MNTPVMQLLAWADRRGPDTVRAVACAVTIAQHAHRGQLRRSGNPYIEHPVAVALILADHGAAPETVIAALLHDIAHPDRSVFQALRPELGDTVVDLVVAYDGFDRAGPNGDLDGADQRVLHIKVADRLHNMRTIRYLDPAKQRRKSVQTRDFVAPLARGIGLHDLGAELDELATATLRAHEQAGSPARSTTGRPAVGVGTLRRALHVGGLLLPAHCRGRWLQEWEGELHAAATFAERLRFVAGVLHGLPSMAFLNRRTEPRC